MEQKRRCIYVHYRAFTVSDLHFQHLHKKVYPIQYCLSNLGIHKCTVKYSRKMFGYLQTSILLLSKVAVCHVREMYLNFSDVLFLSLCFSGAIVMSGTTLYSISLDVVLAWALLD